MEDEMNRNQIDKRASILIIGAGPAGLSSAYYLKSHGFKNVMVMERLGRVGGLCCSATKEPHDSSDWSLSQFRQAFADAYADIRVGREIVI